MYNKNDRPGGNLLMSSSAEDSEDEQPIRTYRTAAPVAVKKQQVAAVVAPKQVKSLFLLKVRTSILV